jgi:CO dehydrogenase/acetyl-CoA synthase beta subunit
MPWRIEMMVLMYLLTWLKHPLREVYTTSVPIEENEEEEEEEEEVEQAVKISKLTHMHVQSFHVLGSTACALP